MIALSPVIQVAIKFESLDFSKDTEKHDGEKRSYEISVDLRNETHGSCNSPEHLTPHVSYLKLAFLA